MATNYRIYLVNEGGSDKTFWAFLQPPNELAGDERVFANSSANLTVEPFRKGYDYFEIPVQYSIGASAGNNAVGINTKVESHFPQKTDLGEAWLVKYFDVPPRKGPNITSETDNPSETQVRISSSEFDKAENEAQRWYSSMSFGIETEAGYMGMTWSPDPAEARTITPKLNFYISTGSFGSNELASWTTVSTGAASINLGDFSLQREVTVTLRSNGVLSIDPGKPTIQSASSKLGDLIAAHKNISHAHAKLVDMACVPLNDGLDLGAAVCLPKQEDWITSVSWHDREDKKRDDALEPVLSGTITVGAAVALTAVAFVLSGITFRIKRVRDGGSSIDFSYDGTRSVASIKTLFETAHQITVYY